MLPLVEALALLVTLVLATAVDAAIVITFAVAVAVCSIVIYTVVRCYFCCF